MQHETDRAEVIAWHTARLTGIAYHQPDKYPKFRDVFPKRGAGPKRPKSGRDVMASLTLMAVAMGGEVTRK